MPATGRRAPEGFDLENGGPMDLNQLGLFRRIAQRLDWLTQRQAVLAENVANSDTPDYRAHDIEPFEQHLRETGVAAGRLQTAVTQPGHIDGRAAPGDVRPRRVEEPYEVKPSGNAVNVEHQMMLVAETAMDHQLALNLYNRSAARRGGKEVVRTC